MLENDGYKYDVALFHVRNPGMYDIILYQQIPTNDCSLK